MEFYHFLKYVKPAVPLIIFDLQDKEICSVRTKENISSDLYEYEILDLSIGPSNLRGCSCSMYITIAK